MPVRILNKWHFIMKKTLVLSLFIFITLVFLSCKESIVENPVVETRGTISVESFPAGAKIIVNNVNTGKVTPDTLMLSPGKYSIQLNYQGIDTTLNAEVKTAEKTTLSCKLNPTFGNLIVSTDVRRAEIYLDEAPTGKTTPDTIKNLLPGQYNLKLVYAGKQTSYSVVVTKWNNSSIYLPFATTLFIVTTPWEAKIAVNGVATGKSTPDSLNGLAPGTYNISLSVDRYFDTTFSVTITEGCHLNKFVSLKYDLQIQKFMDTRIWEVVDSNDSKNLGLDLSTGITYNVNGPDKDKVDIYYNKDGYIVSNNGPAVSINNTWFKPGITELLNDGVAAPLYNEVTWVKKMSEKESSYVFLYDKDGHYSKIKIIRYGWESPGLTGRAWIDFQWIYNKRANDVNFK